MRRRHLLALALALGLTAVVSATGPEPRATKVTRVSAGPPPPPPSSGRYLSKREAFLMGTADVAVVQHCRAFASRESELHAEVRSVARLARKKPDDLGSAYGEPPQTPRSTLVELVEELEAERCAPAVAQTARDALRALPPGP